MELPPPSPDAGVPSCPDTGVPSGPDAGVPSGPDAGVPSPGPTRWGICSAGLISHDFVVALRTLPPEEHVAVAVAARDLSRAVSFSRRHGIPRAYGSYRELAQDPDIDVVYVGVVTPWHLPLARMFLLAGRPVLVEKPLGLNWEQARELVQTARESGVFLMEMVTDIMGGAPRKLRATGTLTPSGVDETVTMTLDFGEKRQAVFTVSITAQLPGAATLGGTRGWAQFPSHMNCPTELVLGGGPQAGGPPGGGPHRETFPLPPPDQPLNFPHGTGLRYEAQHVRQCLLQGLTESPVMPFAASELVAQLLDEARGQVGVRGSPNPPPRPLPPPGEPPQHRGTPQETGEEGK